MTSDKFQARYQIDDGYYGGLRLHYFTISASDLEDDMDDEALERFYEESVQDDFEQHISPKSERVDEFVSWAKERLAKRANG